MNSNCSRLPGAGIMVHTPRSASPCSWSAGRPLGPAPASTAAPSSRSAQQSVLGLSLADLLRARAAASSARAKSVVLLWLWGGPSQLDTCDPKPNAPLEYRGPFGTIPTQIPGVRFCELFPQLAGLTDKLAVIRSLHDAVERPRRRRHHRPDRQRRRRHRPRRQAAARARRGPRSARSSRKALASGEAPATRLPPFFVVGGKLHQGKKAIIGEGGGPLGAAYDPFRLEYDPADGHEGPRPATAAGPDARAARRPADAARRVRRRPRAARPTSAAAGALDDYRAQAFAMLTSPTAAADVRPVAGEAARLADRYGRTRFGQSCLLARRLVEAGVPFVQVNWSDHVEAEEDAGDGGWDHHYRNFQIMQDRHAPWLDQSLSALLDRPARPRPARHRRWCWRSASSAATPKINDKAGREHWPGCYSALLAGGGVNGGRVIGTSDAKAAKPADTPLTPGRPERDRPPLRRPDQRADHRPRPHPDRPRDRGAVLKTDSPQRAQRTQKKTGMSRSRLCRSSCSLCVLCASVRPLLSLR